MKRTAIEQVVAILGSQSAMARALGVKPQAVQQWIMRNRVPPERVLKIERLVDARVTRYDLRPDVYGPAPDDDCRCKAPQA